MAITNELKAWLRTWIMARTAVIQITPISAPG